MVSDTEVNNFIIIHSAWRQETQLIIPVAEISRRYSASYNTQRLATPQFVFR